jgi:hypothetical protein
MDDKKKIKWQWQILKSDIPAPARLVLLTMSIYMKLNGEDCFPSIKELSDVTGLSANTIRKYIRLAVKKKYLKVKNAGFRGAKSQQMLFLPILNKRGVQEVSLSPERGSNGEQRGSAREQRGSAGEPKHNNNITITSKDYLSDSIEVRLSKKLYSYMLERNPEYKKPNFDKWAKHIDRMIRLEKRTPEKIEAVIEWCQADDFWQNNILSTQKLREQYDKLVLKMNKSNPKFIEDPFPGAI